MNETKQPICDALLTKCKSCSGIMQYSPSDVSLKCVYLPFWTYDAETITQYTGERGVNRNETYHNDKGEKKSRTVTDWFPTSGEVSESFDDVVVPASETLPSSIADRLTNWDMANCVAYRKEFLAGFITEIYQIDFRNGVQKAKEKMDSYE